jgi:hypothetical protein
MNRRSSSDEGPAKRDAGIRRSALGFGAAGRWDRRYGTREFGAAGRYRRYGTRGFGAAGRWDGGTCSRSLRMLPNSAQCPDRRAIDRGRGCSAAVATAADSVARCTGESGSAGRRHRTECTSWLTIESVSRPHRLNASAQIASSRTALSAARRYFLTSTKVVVQAVNRVIGASKGLRSHVTFPILWHAEDTPKSDVPDIPDGQAGRQAGVRQ